VPCRADASVMAGVILYIVTRTWCKICRCVDAWGGSRFALRLTLSRQPLPPHAGATRAGHGAPVDPTEPLSLAVSFPSGLRSASREELVRNRARQAARGCLVRRDVSRETRLEKRIGAGPRRRALEWPSAHIWGEHGCISVMCVYDGEMSRLGPEDASS